MAPRRRDFCPNCKRYEFSTVIDTRPSKAVDGAIQRRRICEGCNYKWNTIEIPLQKYNQLGADIEAASMNYQKLLDRLAIVRQLFGEIFAIPQQTKKGDPG